MAPKYLFDLIKLRQPKVYNVRLDDDFYLLDPNDINFRKSKSAFCVSEPIVLNELPHNLKLN